MSLDFKKTHRELFSARAEPALVDVPKLPFLMVNGVGDPAGAAYGDAVGRLYRAAYQVRATFKAAGLVYTVPPLQGLWSSVGDGLGDGSLWNWTMMLMQPAEASPDLVKVADVRLDTFAEGPSVQALHVGPYQEETATIERLLTFVAANGRRMTGRHHEIYLSNPQRTAPEKLRTIIRYGLT